MPHSTSLSNECKSTALVLQPYFSDRHWRPTTMTPPNIFIGDAADPSPELVRRIAQQGCRRAEREVVTSPTKHLLHRAHRSAVCDHTARQGGFDGSASAKLTGPMPQIAMTAGSFWLRITPS